MFTVKLDTKAMVAQLGKQALPVLEMAVGMLGEFAMDRMSELSSKHLRPDTQKQFLAALKVDRKQFEVTITLSDPQMVAIETGFATFDMKPGLLQSKKAKKGKGGSIYMDVPFTHRTTKRGASGTTYIEPRTMQLAVDKAQEELKSAPEGSSVRLFPKVKGSPRRKHTDMKVTKEEAKTFRRVSDKSPADAWIHPGKKGIGVFEAVTQEVEGIKDVMISDLMQGLP